MVRFGERLSLAWKICVTGQKKLDRKSYLEKRPSSFVNLSWNKRKRKKRKTSLKP